MSCDMWGENNLNKQQVGLVFPCTLSAVQTLPAAMQYLNAIYVGKFIFYVSFLSQPKRNEQKKIRASFWLEMREKHG